MIKVTGRWGGRQLPDDVQERKGCWKWKEEALHHTVWETSFARGYGPVV